MPGRKYRKLKVYQNVNGTSRQSNYKRLLSFSVSFSTLKTVQWEHKFCH